MEWLLFISLSKPLKKERKNVSKLRKEEKNTQTYSSFGPLAMRVAAHCE
jgi:hypothetical protein